MGIDPRVRALFPKLNDYNHQKTSPKSSKYNCFAWATGHDDRWVDPYNRRFWLGADGSVDGVISHFAAFGYEECHNIDLDPEYEKVVIYAKHENGVQSPTHAARQLPTGWWTSKLGPNEDIEHSDPSDLNSNDYGEPICFMRRKRTRH